MIHYNAPTKTLYKTEEVHGLLKDELEELIVKQTSEYKRVKNLIETIREYKPKSTFDLLLLCTKTKNLDIMKKYQLILTKIIDEIKRNI